MTARVSWSTSHRRTTPSMVASAERVNDAIGSVHRIRDASAAASRKLSVSVSMTRYCNVPMPGPAPAERTE
ncbi:hypothetical protein [Rhodococcus sp. SORGH_AS_0303]|uniref:hypothetical protein n=1 Tax=Rhodococcus sp. SORGH_AS_0303 TaxID=3041753 RepID=UPI00277F30F1|nr:hypothetical protein [Rhodococcus sp. SORGH_AS_0303]MDQ1200330.1 hypothetical protein [Rhodococcus sp. SORGH_AS_0303]